jgi:anthranilate phosphoribosyltransferase
MREVLEKLLEGQILSKEEALMVFEKMAQGAMSESVCGGILCALRMRGERAEELGTLAEVILKRAKILNPQTRPLLDIVGTGGDNAKTLNISTLSALICAAVGLKVAKHGNRAVSGLLGSADLLEHLGLKIDTPPHLTKRCIEEIGFGFLFAPLYHPILANLAKVRRELGIRTIFNFLGPLINPALPEKLLIGAPTPEGARIMAQALRLLGREGFVIHGLEGLDEVSPEGETLLIEVSSETLREKILTPKDFGLKGKPLSTIKIRDKKEGIERAKRILEGEEDEGLEAVLMEASLGLWLSKKVKDLKEGIEVAREVQKRGEGMRILEKIKELQDERVFEKGL